jgi:hypothetical protein
MLGSLGNCEKPRSAGGTARATKEQILRLQLYCLANGC